MSPTAARGKRALNGVKKTNYTEPETEDDEEDRYVPMSKRVKKEPVEEEAAFSGEFDDEV